MLPLDFTRRTFLVRAGQGSIALAVLGLAGCGPTALASAAASGSDTTPSGDGAGGGGASPAATSVGDATAIEWHRINFGYVSAYILARGGEAAVVDTGLPSSEGTIESALSEAGLSWGSVGHIIATHRHGDHVGSLDAVIAAAPEAAVYAGEADIPSIEARRKPTPVGDGDVVFGLQIVATPGHTAGHISVLDSAGGVLVAGDALSTSDGKVGDSNPRFTDDMDQAMASIRKLGGLAYEILLVGHGEPILSGAAAQVAAFAAAG